MNRREFLKAGGAAIAAASFPKIAATAAPAKSELRHGRIDNVRFYDAPSYGPGRWDEFNPAYEYGNGMLLTDRPDPAFADKLIETLYQDMARFIPPSYRNKVRIIGPEPRDFGRSMSIAWKYRP